MFAKLILLSLIAKCCIGCKPNSNRGFFEKPIKILSLNMWGVNPFEGLQDSRMGFLSPHKTERVDATSKAIEKAEHDIVFLQEVWFKEDHDKLAASMNFSTYFGLDTQCAAQDKPNQIVFPTHCHGLVTLSSIEM